MINFLMRRRRDKKSFLGLVFCFFLFYLVYGCAGGQERKEIKDPFFEKWRDTAEKSRGYSPPARKRVPITPEEKAEPVVGPEITPEPEKQLPTQPTTLEMFNTDVSVLLRALARAVEQNIIINENVKGKVNINVKEAPWDQIFRGILRTHGLDYGWEGDIIHIITPEDTDKALKQLEAEQKIKSKKREIEMVEPLITRIVNVDYTDASKLKENLEKFLTEKAEGKPLGSVMVDAHSNALIIQAIQGDIARMLPIIDELDRPTPQILIEAHIVETTRETARALGIKWGGLYHDPGANFWLAPGASAGVGVTPGTYATEDRDGNPVDPAAGTFVNPGSGFAVNLPITATPGLTLGLIAEELGGNILALQLEALETDGKLNILSSPSITTLDNQKAIIESGEESPYQTVEEGSVKIEYKKAVLSLEVTPHVIDGKTLKMEIKTSKDELDFTRGVQGNPVVITKKAETNVILFDGQTTVIGGLSKDRELKQGAGIPLLKDIPLLGYLFKSKGDSSTMEEVLIFITPHILKERVEDISYPQPPEPETSPTDELSKVAPSEKPSFSVQAGTFVNKEDAYKLVTELKWKGYEPYIFESSDAMNQVVYAVRIGDYGDLDAALQSVSQLEQKDKMPAVITHTDSLSVVENKSTQP